MNTQEQLNQEAPIDEIDFDAISLYNVKNNSPLPNEYEIDNEIDNDSRSEVASNDDPDFGDTLNPLFVTELENIIEIIFNKTPCQDYFKTSPEIITVLDELYTLIYRPNDTTTQQEFDNKLSKLTDLTLHHKPNFIISCVHELLGIEDKEALEGN